MTPGFVAIIVFVCLFVAVFIGMALRRVLPKEHLSSETKDVVKTATGMVATMAALILGLLVSSAKSAYDTKNSEVIQMAAKVAFLDRVLAAYGPEAEEARAQFRETAKEAVNRIWSREREFGARLAPNIMSGNRVYTDIQQLSPHSDMQNALKSQANSLAADLGQLRSLLVAQSVPSISITLLVVLVSWLFLILVSFSLFAPPNATAILALAISALSLAGAIFLILELDEPFNGLIRISNEPMLSAIGQLER